MFYKLHITTNLKASIVLLRYIYIANKIIKKREQSTISCFCDAYNLTLKNNNELTRYLAKYQVIRETKRRRKLKSKKKIKKNSKENSKENNLY